MKYLSYEEINEVAIITICRKDSLNALNSHVLEELKDVIEGIDVNIIRCVIITGDGDKSFVAGADVLEMRSFTQKQAEEFSKKGNGIFRKIETLKIPVIAAINGFALGGGCELAMCCDIRLCSENAIFGQPEVSLGIPPGFGGTQRLSRIVGQGVAKYMIFSGKNIDAQEAFRVGLVNGVYSQDQLRSEALKLAKEIIFNAPIAIANSKFVINEGFNKDIDDALHLEVKAFSNCFGTADQKEGMKAFLEKKKERIFINS